jgi:microcystin synthetase protein McyA
VEYEREKLMHELFEEEAERNPGRVAVMYEGKEMSYQEVNERSNQLGHYLRERGVGPEVRVGICMERSFEMVIAVMGVLKAGGAYVPVDPTYPVERQAFTLADAEAPVMLTQERLREEMNKDERGGAVKEVISLDGEWEKIGEYGKGKVRSGVRGENLAYVIYTSGSTGKPKGAMISHEGIRNRVMWAQERYRLGEEDRVPQKTPFSFDVSVWEFLWPLAVGARIVMAVPGGQRDTAYMVKLMEETGVTLMHLVTPMLRAMLEAEGLERCKKLKYIITGGEQLQFEDQERFY